MAAAATRLIAPLAWLIGGLFATHVLAASITYDALNRPTLIPAIDVPGEGKFNVLVRYESFESIFGSGNPPSPHKPLFWGDLTAAHTATVAISQALNDDGPVMPILPSSIFLFFISVPYEYDSRPGNTLGWVLSRDVYIFPFRPDPMYSGDDGSDVTAPTASLEYVGWASFAVVPESTTLTLASVGLLALIGAWKWRQIRDRSRTCRCG
jgi:hypothetical protein